MTTFNQDLTLTLLLDSLDEVRIHVKTACSVLTEGLRKVDKNRLRLRICCRSGHWPEYFSDDLRRLWGEEQVAIYRILPLRPCDVEEAVQQTDGSDPRAFMSVVRDKDVQPFAAKPITLMILIEEFALKRALPGSQWEIYEKLCLKLCDDPNPRYREIETLKQSYNLDKTERIKVASKIAAVMMLCNRKLACFEEKIDDSPENVLFFEEVGEGKETHGLIAKAVFKETVGKTAIFHCRDNQLFTFGHQTYMEFLAAKYLCDICTLPFGRLKKILSTEVAGVRKVTPQLRELAAWCSSRRSKLKKWMIRNDPITMICSDLSVLTDQEKYRLVENLLFELDRLEFFDPSFLWEHGRKLKHSKLGEQLRGCIEDVAKSSHVRNAAIDIARQCSVSGLGDLLLDIISNCNEQPRIRAHACYALEKVGSAEERKSVKSILLGTDEQLYDKLKGGLLRILWPDFINVDELLTVLTPRLAPDTIGTYDMFIHDLGDTIETSHIPHVLEHFIGFKVPKSKPGYSFERMLDKLFVRSLTNLEVPNMKRVVAKYMLGSYAIDHKIVRHDAQKDFHKIIESNVNTRRVLVTELLEVGVPAGVESWVLESCVSPIVDFEDFFWLLDSVDNNTVANKIILMNEAYRYLVQHEGLSVTSEHVTCFLDKLGQCETEVQEDFIILQGVSLDSKYAKQGRKLALVHKKHAQEEETRKKTQPKPEDVIERELPKAMEGQSNAWFWVCCAICSEGERMTDDYIQRNFLSESQRWKDLDKTTQSSVIVAAQQFLLKNPPEDHNWLSNNSRSNYIWSWQIALSLIAHPKDHFDNLPIDILKAWIPTVVGFWGRPDEGFKKVIRYSYEKCPKTFIEYLNVRLDADVKTDFISSIVDCLSEILDKKLLQYLFDKIKEKGFGPTLFNKLCILLIEPRPNGFEEFLVSKFYPPGPTNESEKKMSAIAFRIVLCNWSVKYWDEIRMCLSKAPELCLTALYDLSYDYRHGKADPLLHLDMQQLAELYVWLRNYKNQREGTVSTRRGSMEDYSYLTIDNYIINRLVKSATPESMNSLNYIKKHLKDEHKEYFKYHINLAKEEQQRVYWQRYKPKEVIEFQRPKLIIRLLFLTLIMLILYFVLYLIVTVASLDQFVTKLLGGYWTLFGLTTFAGTCLWWRLLTENEKKSFKEIKSKFDSWRS